MTRAPVTLAFWLALVACRPPAPSASEMAQAATPTSTVAVALPPVDASTPRDAPGALGTPIAVGYTASGILVVQTTGGLVTYPQGLDAPRSELPLPPHVAPMVGVGPRDTAAIGFEAVSIADGAAKDSPVLVSFAPLALVGRAQGVLVGAGAGAADWGIVLSPAASADVESIAVMASGSRTLVHLTLPPGSASHVRAIDVAAGGDVAIVSVDTETDVRTSSFDLKTGRFLADLAPDTAASPAAYRGDTQLAFRDGELVAVDVTTGRTTARAPAPCKAAADGFARGRANAHLDPTKTRLLATCNRDGELFDVTTLRRVRMYKNMIPTCDSSDFLPGYFRDDGKTWVLQACDGDARIDLTTAAYACADKREMLGATSAPALPRCHDAEFHLGETVPRSPHWELHELPAGPREMVGPGGARFALRSGASLPEIAPAEDQLAIVENSRVIVRALPSGAILRELSY